jgi:hypothetical protein
MTSEYCNFTKLDTTCVFNGMRDGGTRTLIKYNPIDFVHGLVETTFMLLFMIVIVWREYLIIYFYQSDPFCSKQVASSSSP